MTGRLTPRMKEELRTLLSDFERKDEERSQDLWGEMLWEFEMRHGLDPHDAEAMLERLEAADARTQRRKQ